MVAGFLLVRLSKQFAEIGELAGHTRVRVTLRRHTSTFDERWISRIKPGRTYGRSGR
jgi:hypothetical protein